MERCVICPGGLGCPNSLLLDPPDPDPLSGPSNALQQPDFDSPSYPLLPSDPEATGDPGQTTSGDRQTIRVRLQLQGEWRYVRGEWYPTLDLVEVYGNGEIELDTGHAANLDEAVAVTAAVCFEQFERAG